MTLAERLNEKLQAHGAVAKRMFSGTAFMIGGNLAIGTHKDGLIVRVGKEAHAAALKRPGARIFDMTGRPMEGWVVVDGKALATGTALTEWIDLALAFVRTLPVKQVKPVKPKKGKV